MRALFGVRYPRRSSEDAPSVLDSDKEVSYESEASARVLFDAGTRQFRAVPVDYRFETETDAPFSSPKQTEPSAWRLSRPLFDPTLDQGMSANHNVEWWQGIFGGAPQSQSTVLSVRELHYFKREQTWLGQSSLAFEIGIGDELAVWKQGSTLSALTSDTDLVQFSSGWKYNFLTHLGSPIPSENAPSPRRGYAFATLGHKLLIWGGRNGTGKSEVLRDGAIYDFEQNQWTKIPADGAPECCHKCSNPTAVSVGEIAEVYYYDVSCSDISKTGALYDARTNRFAKINSSGAPAIALGWNFMESSTRMGSRLVSIANGGWIFDPMSNSWSSFELPQDVELYPHVLSTGQYLLLGSSAGQITAYLVYPAQRQTCRLPLAKVPIFARRKQGFESEVLQVVDLDGRLLFWGRRDTRHYGCQNCKMSSSVPDDVLLSSGHYALGETKSNQGVIYTLPVKP